MKEHTVKSYDEELAYLAKMIAEMSNLVFEAIDIAEHAFENYGINYCQKALDHDKKINEMNHLIADQATVLIALRQPLAFDLRFVISSFKIATNLERMGDSAKSSTKRISKIECRIPPVAALAIKQMIASSRSMAQEAMATLSLHSSDADDKEPRQVANILKVLARDDEVDKLYYDLIGALVNEMKDHPDDVASLTNIIFVAKNLERIGDYATNIAEVSYYVRFGTWLAEYN